jgi:hypothetical protein
MKVQGKLKRKKKKKKDEGKQERTYTGCELFNIGVQTLGFEGEDHTFPKGGFGGV